MARSNGYLRVGKGKTSFKIAYVTFPLLSKTCYLFPAYTVGRIGVWAVRAIGFRFRHT